MMVEAKNDVKSLEPCWKQKLVLKKIGGKTQEYCQKLRKILRIQNTNKS